MEERLGNPFQAIFESVVEGVIVTGEDGKILLANPAAERLFDRTKLELQGLGIEDLIPKELRKQHVGFRSTYMESPSPRKMGRGRDLVALRKDGSTFPVEVSLSHATLDDQMVVIAFLIDITERKKAEDAIKKSEEKLIVYAAELEKRVSDRTRELADAIDNLEAANKELQEEIQIRKQAESEAQQAFEKEKELNELKSRFVSLASHEFRTPLSTILSSVSLIARYDTPETADKRQKHIDRIKNNVRGLTALLNDFLNLERLEAGDLSANLEKFSLRPFMEEICDEIQGIAKRGQIITLEADDQIRTVSLDKQLLKNICLNLLSNAIKYSPEKRPIHFAYHKAGDEMQLQVVDQGMGIAKSEQVHLFERFFRSKEASGIQGTGLGLYIVKKYVEQMRGTITFESKYQEGSTFTITLPLTDA